MHARKPGAQEKIEKKMSVTGVGTRKQKQKQHGRVNGGTFSHGDRTNTANALKGGHGQQRFETRKQAAFYSIVLSACVLSVGFFLFHTEVW